MTKRWSGQGTSIRRRGLQVEQLESRRLLAPLVVHRVNAGGVEIADSPAWSVDTDANPSAFSNFNPNSSTSKAKFWGNPIDTSATPGVPEAIFQSDRFDKPNQPNLEWDFPVTPGEYEVRLYFAENWSGGFSTGAREFDVEIEGVKVLDNYDIFTEAGGAQTAVVETFTVTSDGNLDIDFFRNLGKNNPIVNAIEIVDPDGDGGPGGTVWSEAAPSPIAVFEGQGAAVGDELYVIGGFVDFLGVTTEVYSYAPATDTWTQRADFPEITEAVIDSQGAATGEFVTGGITHGASAVDGDKIYVVGGYVGESPGQSTAVVSVYDTVADTWTTTTSLPEPRGGGGVAIVGRELHYFGGGTRTFGELEIFDQPDHWVLDLGATDSAADDAAQWTQLADIPTPRNHSSGAVIDGIIYAVGGQLGDNEFTQNQQVLEAYNPATNTWTQLADIPIPLGHLMASVAVVDGKLITFGGVTNNDNPSGQDGTRRTATVYSYDPATDQWSTHESLPDERQSPAVGLVNGQIVVASGASAADREFTTFVADATELLAKTGSNLVASFNSLDFGTVTVGQSGSQVVTLTNTGQAGDGAITIDPASASLAAGGEFAFDFGGSAPIVLQPGQATDVTIDYTPVDETPDAVTLTIPHDGINTAIDVALTGVGEVVGGAAVVVYRINAGGAALADSPSWAVDTDANPSPFSNFDPNSSTSKSKTWTPPVDGSNLPNVPTELFQTERFDKPNQPNLEWDFSVAPGEYEVRLYFAENWQGAFANGVREFDVEIEGVKVLDNFDVFANFGAQTGGVQSFQVTSDGNLDIDFMRNPGKNNPNVKGIEILTVGEGTVANLGASSSSLGFGTVEVGASQQQQLTLTHLGVAGDDPITIDPSAASVSPAGEFSFSFTTGSPIVLQAGESTIVTVDYAPLAAGADAATLTIPHDGLNTPTTVALSGAGQDPGSQTANLGASSSSLGFGTVEVGASQQQQLTLTHLGVTGDDPITIDPSAASVSPAGEFSFSFTTGSPIVLQAGDSTVVTVSYAPTDVGADAATLTIPHDGANSPTTVALSGTGEDAGPQPIDFDKSVLGGLISSLERPTSLQFGPDGRLYVAEQNGLIRAYTITQNGPKNFVATGEEVITEIVNLPNRDDDGTLNPSVAGRLVTGLLVAGTASNPVLYVTSADPRIGGGPTGEDLNLDTNSGILTRLTWNGSSWDQLDLVRGLPRSEENHTANGMALDEAAGTLYIAVGGNTNAGAPSNNFAFLPEYALSAAILSIDLDAIGETTYDIPTLDDEDQPGTDATDPFGGNSGKNQAILVPGGPVQVYAPGFRNPYDVVLTSNGKLYSVDNGPNAGWGDVPIGEGPGGNATNDVNEPGLTYGDGLHYITGQGYYGGHPNPTRSNPANTFNDSNPQSPVSVANPIESDYLIPGVEDGSLIVYPESTNGIAEYTAGDFGGALQGDLIIASFDNTIKRVKLNAAGDQIVQAEDLFSNVGFRPLDVTSPGTGAFAGSIWVADIALETIIVYEPKTGGTGSPDDDDGDGYTNDDEIANGTDPNNSGDFPADNDGDFVSDLLDPDDDNDLLNDSVDPFAVDPDNGSTTPIGVSYEWENEGENLGGLLGLGFTGLMSNGADDYQDLFDTGALTAGGAAGVFTLDSATSGTALGFANNQEQAFQFGFNAAAATGPFAAETAVVGAFNGVTPEAGQQVGLYIGLGDQNNYVQIVLAGDNGGQIEVTAEFQSVPTTLATTPLPLPGPNVVDLRLTIDPATLTLQASYSTDGVNYINLGPALAIPPVALSGSLAAGLISTNPSSNPLPVTWDFIRVVPTAAPAALTVESQTPLVAIAGDYDGNGVVDELDHEVWASTYGGTADLRADGNGNGRVDIGDYGIWREQVGDWVPSVITPAADTASNGPVGFAFLTAPPTATSASFDEALASEATVEDDDRQDLLLLATQASLAAGDAPATLADAALDASDDTDAIEDGVLEWVAL